MEFLSLRILLSLLEHADFPILKNQQLMPGMLISSYYYVYCLTINCMYLHTFQNYYYFYFDEVIDHLDRRDL